MGDFNARTGVANDVVTIDESVVLSTGTDADLFDSFDSNDKAELLGIDLTRHSQDKVVNGNGIELLRCCKIADLKILNGRFGQDSGVGSFTCSNANGSSVVDYAVASTSLLPDVTNFRVDVQDKCLSDIHCSLSLSLSIQGDDLCHKEPFESEQSMNATSNTVIFTRWEQLLSETYLRSFDHSKIQAWQQTLDGCDHSTVDQQDIDQYAADLCNILLEPAKGCGMQKQRKQSNIKPKPKDKPWFDSECRVKRREYCSRKHEISLSNHSHRKLMLAREAKVYKKFITSKKEAFLARTKKKLTEVRIPETTGKCSKIP